MVFTSGWYFMTLVIKASSRLVSKVHAISNTDTSLDSSSTTTTSGVFADSCEKAFWLLQRWNIDAFTQACVYIFTEAWK